MVDIAASHLCKRFGEQVVIDDVSFEIKKGTIFGLLGPNASGKTTLIKILCGLIKPSSGDIFLNHKDIKASKFDFGYVSQHFGLYEELTVLENMVFFADLYNIKDQGYLMELLARYGLEVFSKKRAGHLSGGFKRRLALACALIHDPDILFLDEPTAGIDPITRKTIWDDLYQLRSQGKTLLVTTHYMEEAQRCDTLAFISAGKIIAQGSPASMIDTLGEVNIYVTDLVYHPAAQELLTSKKGIVLVNQFGRQLRVIAHPDIQPQAVEAWIFEATGVRCKIERSSAMLEDVFIALNSRCS